MTAEKPRDQTTTRNKENECQMKKCTWCGKEYPNSAEYCSIDAYPLESEEPEPVVPAPAPPLVWQPRLLDLQQFENAFINAEGYSRPNWKVIRQIMNQRISPVDLSEAWTEVPRQWR